MKFAIIEVDITPDEIFPLAGFAKRSSRTLNFGANRLFVRIIRLKSKSDQVFFIMMDSLYFSEKLASFIQSKLTEYFDAKMCSMIFNASHTHSAPNLFGGAFGDFNREYYESVKDKISVQFECLRDMVGVSANISIYPLPPNIAVNRRKRLNSLLSKVLRQKIVMQPNKSKAIKIPVYLVEFETTKGDVHLLYSLSCHPVFSNTNYISSDYPGLINTLLTKKDYISASFLQGFCGDIKPNITNKRNIFSANLKCSIKSILFGEVFRECKPSDLDDFSKKIKRSIVENDTAKTKLDVLNAKSIAYSSTLESSCGSKTKKLNVKLLLLGKKVLFVSVAAEVSFGYYNYLQTKFPELLICPLGYAEKLIGYLPEEEDLKLGGYEVNSYKNYSWPSPLSASCLSNFKEKMTQEIKRMVITE